jgi:hypothetical protein
MAESVELQLSWIARLIAQDRHKSYVDQKRRHLEFQVGDHVYLKVNARKRYR